MTDDFPRLGSDERFEIEEIRDRLNDAGYELHFDSIDQGWVAALIRYGMGTGAAPTGFGETALEAAKNAWDMYESREELRSFTPDPEQVAKRSDRYFFLARGTLVIRKGNGTPWLVSWYPNEGDPDYPGFTLDSSTRDFPIDEGVVGVLRWAVQQKWLAGGEEPAGR